jgi:hypothetical protein
MPDRGYVLSQPGSDTQPFSPPTCERGFYGPPNSRPPTVATSADGRTVAFVEHPKPPHCGEDQIVVLHDGRRLIVPRPPAPGTNIADRTKHPGHQYWVWPRVSSSGTLFATLEDDLQGMRTGISRWAFVYADSRWKQLSNPFLTLPYDPEPLTARQAGPFKWCVSDVSIAAALSIYKFSLNSDCDDLLGLPSDRIAVLPETAIIQDKKQHLLGFGTITAMSDDDAVGYSSVYGNLQPPKALYWHGAAPPRMLGLGIAADVDSDGTVVGDDRQQWAESGHPTVWSGKSSIQLSSKSGAAFAILDHLVVGSVNGRAFSARLDDPDKALHYFDRVGGNWTLTSAFAIARTGRIFAIGKDRKGTAVVVSLDPGRKTGRTRPIEKDSILASPAK